MPLFKRTSVCGGNEVTVQCATMSVYLIHTQDCCILSRLGGLILKFHNLNTLMRIKSMRMHYMYSEPCTCH